MTSTTDQRTSRIRLARAFGDLARQVMPFAAASSAMGETGAGSLSSRAVQVYGARPEERSGSEPDQLRNRA
ncbi:hypothetical protein [uncultured Enterovirga sp.]|uniref:hypothetical protein n=1 Tax=uncultured Enterovirga sp. TaxID=2026352 RepID=UPI0035CBBDC7